MSGKPYLCSRGPNLDVRRAEVQADPGTCRPMRRGAALSARAEAQDRLAAGERWTETRLVFTTAAGTGMNAANVRRDFRRALALVPGLDPARVHTYQVGTAGGNSSDWEQQDSNLRLLACKARPVSGWDCTLSVNCLRERLRRSTDYRRGSHSVGHSPEVTGRVGHLVRRRATLVYGWPRDVVASVDLVVSSVVVDGRAATALAC